MAAMSLWSLGLGECTSRRASSFTEDYQVLLGQLVEDDLEMTLDRRSSFRVCGMPLAPLRRFAEDQGPEPERYESEAIQIAVERRVIGKEFLSPRNSSAWWKGIPQPTMKVLYKLAFKRYVAGLANAIVRGEDIPPLITVNGSVADGRHRIFAALELKLQVVPVLEIASISGASTGSTSLLRAAMSAPPSILGPALDSPRAGAGQQWKHAVSVSVGALAGMRVRSLPHMARGVTGSERLASLRRLRVLPPIEIAIAPDGKMRLLDGNHRLIVARERGDESIRVAFLMVPKSDDRFA